MTGGGGNDTFAFLQVPTAPGQITDFNNTTQHDRIAISANGFGGGLTAGMDVTSTFESSGRQYVLGLGRIPLRHGEPDALFQRGRHPGSAHAVVAVQAGAVINPHDILIV